MPVYVCMCVCVYVMSQVGVGENMGQKEGNEQREEKRRERKEERGTRRNAIRENSEFSGGGAKSEGSALIEIFHLLVLFGFVWFCLVLRGIRIFPKNYNNPTATTTIITTTETKTTITNLSMGN